jgi:hypothetical protein
MPYAIMRFAKKGGAPARSLEAHHERKKEIYKSNPDIDLSKSKLNYHFIAPKKSYYREIKTRLETADCKVRKDSVKFVDTIITASPEFFKKHKREDAKKFFELATRFMAQEVGHKNIFSAAVHMDETTPHMHLCFTPITADKRLCAKDILGDRAKLSQWQDKFHAHMSAAFPELERGEPAAETRRKHIPTWLFKQATKLTAHMQDVQKLLDEMNLLNVPKKREEVIKSLEKWLPKAFSFERQIRAVKKGNEELKDEIAALEVEKSKLKSDKSHYMKELTGARMEVQDLTRKYKRVKDFCDLIPEDLKQELFTRNKNLQKMARERGKERDR